MITLEIDPTMFGPGKPLEGISSSRAVISIGRKVFVGKKLSPSKEEGQYQLNVRVTPTTMTDENFYYLVQTPLSQDSYAKDIVNLIDKGAIIVKQNGAVLTTNAIVNFTV